MNFFAIWTMGLLCLVEAAYSNSLEAVKADVPASNRIVGGVPALAGEFPSMVALLFDGGLKCGGTLLGPYHVLTSTLCLLFIFVENPLSRLKVKIVNNFPVAFDTPCSVEVSKFITHPNITYDPLNNDIGIVVLSSPVTNSALYAKLPTVFNSYANQLAVIAGWGSTSPDAPVSNILLKTNVTIQDNTICTNQYGSKFVTGNQLCASAPGKGPCYNDYGGPIFVNGVQVGINSYGNGCSDSNHAGVFTRITSYTDWIKTTVANNPGPTSG